MAASEHSNTAIPALNRPPCGYLQAVVAARETKTLAHKMALMRIFLVLGIVATCLLSQEVQPELCGRFVEEGGARRLELWGTPEERGFAHGFLMAERIMESFESDLGMMLMGRYPRYESRVRADLLPNFDFTKSEEAELAAMLKGMQSKLPGEGTLLKKFKRAADLADLKAINTAGDWAPYGCSSLALDGGFTLDGDPVVVRNFDYFGLKLLLDHQFVVAVKPAEGGFGFVGVSYPGSIGVITGLNSEAFFTAIHDVPVLGKEEVLARPNVPRLIAQRRLLLGVGGLDALETARKNVKVWPTMFGNNFMVASGKFRPRAPFAAVLEYDLREDIEGGVTMRCADREGESATALASTNHHRLRGDRETPPTCERYAALLAEAEARRGKARLSLDDLFAVASVAALPKAPRKQAKLMHGTVHQAVALLGLCEFHVKLGRAGSNIRDIKPVRVAVREILPTLKSATR